MLIFSPLFEESFAGWPCLKSGTYGNLYKVTFSSTKLCRDFTSVLCSCVSVDLSPFSFKFAQQVKCSLMGVIDSATEESSTFLLLQTFLQSVHSLFQVLVHLHYKGVSNQLCCVCLNLCCSISPPHSRMSLSFVIP